jgi:hypothetical protein
LGEDFYVKLTIVGRPIGSGVNQMLLRDATKYYIGILMSDDPRRMDTIEIEVNLVNDLIKDFHNSAMCGWLDDRFRPNRFFIDLDSSNEYKTQLIALGHELTHVKQMAMGERQEAWDGQTMRWFGRVFDPSTMHYYDLPWEIEAHGREYGLYDRFVESLQAIQGRPATIIGPVKLCSIK